MATFVVYVLLILFLVHIFIFQSFPTYFKPTFVVPAQ